MFGGEEQFLNSGIGFRIPALALAIREENLLVNAGRYSVKFGIEQVDEMSMARQLGLIPGDVTETIANR